MLTLIGLDLAWTTKNPTGVCVVDIDDEDQLTVRDFDARCLSPDAAVALATARDCDTVVCIDAPLVLDEQRLAERELARVFGKAHAAPFTARREFLQKFDGLAGPNVAAALLEKKFLHSSFGRGIGPARWMIEVYPHACHVSLWELPERIKFKKGKLAERRIGILIYQRYLRALLEREWPALLAQECIADALTPEKVNVAGTALKDLEDRLDALTCVYTAHHAWTYGTEGLTTYGTPKTGAIVVPKWPAGKSWLPV